MASSEPTDAALLGDRADPAGSFSTFYRRHVGGVLAYCASRGLNAHDAADHTADIFLAALTGRHRFDPSRGESAAPWLYGIATHVLAGTLRRGARERAVLERLRDRTTRLTERDTAEYAELRAEVDTALQLIADLPPGQRAAVIGRHVEDAEYLELAERDGVSEQVVRQWVSRGLSSVRSRMGARP